MSEYVYFIRAEDSHVKIGKTTVSPEQRLKQLQTGSAAKLELEGVIETSNSNLLESELHSKYSNRRVRNEWFDLSEKEVRQIIEGYSSKLEDIFKWDMNSYRVSNDLLSWELLSSDFGEFARKELSERIEKVELKVDRDQEVIKDNIGTNHEFDYKQARIAVDNKNGVRFEIVLNISSINVSLNIRWLGDVGKVFDKKAVARNVTT